MAGELVIAAIWITQFSFLIYYRFSHAGKVCSGDYSSMGLLLQKEKAQEDNYDIYYMREEGKFFYYYFMTCVILILILVVIFIFISTFFMLGGAFVALRIVQEMIENAEILGDNIKNQTDKFKKQKEEHKSAEEKFKEQFR